MKTKFARAASIIRTGGLSIASLMKQTTAASAIGEREEVAIIQINDRITRVPGQLARRLVWLNVQWSDINFWARQTTSISARSQTGRLDRKDNLREGHYSNSG